MFLEQVVHSHHHKDQRRTSGSTGYLAGLPITVVCVFVTSFSNFQVDEKYKNNLNT
jgi:hypothetical protein